jgi:dihydroneopterin aldolase
MDIVFISEIRVETIIGIFDWERSQKQVVTIDLEMATDVARSAASDSIDDALNYKAVSKRVEQFTADSSFQLVETLAERLAEIIRDEFGVPWLRIIVHKPGALSNSRDVGIRIERGQRPA